ncbi:MAG: STAS domain-containing protein [Anaerolineae bacterium]|nr:STAS domain-containing protein [Anaerolineae bacterium]
MADAGKTKQELFDELVTAKQELADLKAVVAAHAEQQLSVNQQKMLEAAGVGMYLYKFDGSMLFMDQGALKIFEIEDVYQDPYAVQGKKIGDLMVYTGPRGRLRAEMRERGKALGVLYHFQTLKGNQRWCLHDSYVIQHPETGEDIIQAIIRDITKQKLAEAEQQQLQEEIIEAQQRAIQELSTPIIPVMDGIIVMPLIGSIDSLRAKDLLRTLLAGIGTYRARVVILDITGVSIVDTGIVNHLDKTIQAARLKGARTIVTGISDAVAETIVDLGIDWSGIDTLADLRTGLIAALDCLGIRLARK